MKNLICFVTSLILFLSTLQHAAAQDYLLTQNELVEKQSNVVTAFEKFNKKPKKKRLKKKFEERFNEAVSNQLLQLNKNAIAGPLYDVNWEGQLNAMYTLQYLKELSAIAPESNTVVVKDYIPKIDSVQALATQSLYLKGKNALQSNQNKFSYANAYKYFQRVLDITPNYNDTNQLLEQAIFNGTKKVVFLPVGYDNLGNTVEFSFGNDENSSSSDFINTHLKNTLKENNVGSVFQNQKNLNTDWTLQLKWLAVDKLPERIHSYNIERNTTVKENGNEKTVYATVNYTEKNFTYTGDLNCEIYDVKDNYLLVNKIFSGSVFYTIVSATYTGDKRALLQEDINVINTVNFEYLFSNSEALERLYDEDLQFQLLNTVGPLLNWNY